LDIHFYESPPGILSKYPFQSVFLYETPGFYGKRKGLVKFSIDLKFLYCLFKVSIYANLGHY